VILNPPLVFFQPHPLPIVGDKPPTTWAELSAIVPALVTLEAEAKWHRKRIGRRGNPWPIYSDLKRRWSRLVGWDQPNPRLGSSAVYDIAQARIARALVVR
jgi:hypothetical protein